jgi:4-oxalocrotonate tautomerase
MTASVTDSIAFFAQILMFGHVTWAPRLTNTGACCPMAVDAEGTLAVPMITVRYVTPSEREDMRPDIAQFASRTAAEHFGTDENITAVLVEAANPAGWFIAGQRPTEAGLSAFWLDIKITEHTQNKNATTAFVAAVYAGMNELLGPLHDECYVLAHAVDGDAYGYGGRTQNGRWVAGRPD